MTTNIAIIDDDEGIVDAVQLVLSVNDWEVRGYPDGESFLVDLVQYLPDCVILDPHLPGMGGAEVARYLANDATDIPVVGLTARPTSPTTLEVIDAGARVMLFKPVTAGTLIREVQAAVGIRPRSPN